MKIVNDAPHQKTRSQDSVRESVKEAARKEK